jgi:hypothetical protein
MAFEAKPRGGKRKHSPELAPAQNADHGAGR